MTTCSLLVKPVLVSGCHVRRLQASSEALVIDSLRDQIDPVVEVVGLGMILLEGEKDPMLELKGVKVEGGAYEFTCGDWNGFPADGTDNLRPGVLCPYRLAVRECEDIGDCSPEAPHRGLFWPVEKVAEVGVLNPGEFGRY